ncbi:MAG TPA: metalloregulator ArsR/SmtB family transcription factor [Gemmatimonadales bacterium]|nr:metalloregulator ArsR/SmtB family transcription factor [Gemmatimonadales bacterium]
MAVSVLEDLGVLADETRGRLLLLLDRHELSVSELCAVLQLPQSTVSRHLKVLSDAGWVVARAEGTARHYTLAPSLDPAARRLWQLVRARLAGDLTAEQDAERLRSVLAERRSRSQEFFSSSAGQWDALRAELFGARAELAALPGLLDEDWAVGDLGCGTGQLALAFAPFVRRVIAVDQSRAMLAAARARLRDWPNAETRVGELEDLPVEAGELDVALLSLVLPYVVEPRRVLAEAFRTLRPGGRVLVVDMTPHARDEYRQTMGHLWQGFSADQMTQWLAQAGFEHVRHRILPADARAKGPALFAATARRPGAARNGGRRKVEAP